jgi:DNA-binding CsgD family transcriptional regulator
MPKRSLPLDCLPLDTPSSARLSHEQLRVAESLQRVLLSPHDYAGIDAWRAAANTEAVAATGGDAAMFQLMLPDIVPHYSEELCMERLRDYPEIMPSLEVQQGIFRRAISLGAGNRYALWLEHLEWLYASDYFNGLISELRAFDTLFAAVPSTDAPYPAMLHVYHERRREGPRFDASHVRMMQLVKPAFEAGVRAAERTLANRASFVASLETRRDGALVFGRGGRLLYQNRSFGTIVPLARDSTTVVDAGRRMAAGLLSDEERLRFDPDTARQAVSAGPDILLLTAVMIAPGMFDSGPAALVTVHTNEAAVPDSGVLRDRFDLTPRQVEVARLLARRLTNDEIAQRLQVSPNTARRHTEAVMGKLEVRDRRKVGTRLQGSSTPAPVDRRRSP